jgi:hypothetical protein
MSWYSLRVTTLGSIATCSCVVMVDVRRAEGGVTGEKATTAAAADIKPRAVSFLELVMFSWKKVRNNEDE